ncbi:MAG: cellulose binding domain-containing protein, partial [Verrucomicrobiota bacterium]|nr:cellulose binding domain-containing protein [Verrucomicrobiota bacterium]
MRRLFIFLFTASIAAAAPAGKVFVGFTAANAWEMGFTGRITITNQTSWTIYDWRLEFELGHPIKKIWNGRVASAT